MNKNTIAAATLALVMIAPATLAVVNTPATEFVTFETGQITAKVPAQGVIIGTFEGERAETTFKAIAGGAIAGSVSIPISKATGNWTYEMKSTTGTSFLRAEGFIAPEYAMVTSRFVDEGVINLPPTTVSLWLLTGYVSAVVTAEGEVKEDNCCTASLAIDTNADGATDGATESATGAAAGRHMTVTVRLAAAPASVPYLFEVKDRDGTTVGHASGTYSFARLNSVSADAEFDPNVVAFFTASVDRDPHLIQHPIHAETLTERILGSARNATGAPPTFFTIGQKEELTNQTGSIPLVGGDTNDTGHVNQTMKAASTETDFVSQVLAVFTAPMVVAIVVLSVLGSALAFIVLRPKAR